MAKFYGMVGYAVTEETTPGVWTETIVERPYYGNVLRNYRRISDAGKVNSDVSVSVEVSIVSDPFAYENFHSIRYVEYMGTKWEVTSIDAFTYPRLSLTLGGVYNAEPGGSGDGYDAELEES